MSNEYLQRAVRDLRLQAQSRKAKAAEVALDALEEETKGELATAQTLKIKAMHYLGESYGIMSAADQIEKLLALESLL